MKNAPPDTIWTALRRVYDCNKQQLAARLGITSRTLRRWEAGEEMPADAMERARRLLQTGISAVWPVTDQRPDERDQ